MPKRSKKMSDDASELHTSFPDEVPQSADELVTPEVPASSATSLAAELLAGEVRDTAMSVGRVVKEQIGRFTSDIGGEFSKTADHQKMRGVEAMQAFARAVNTAADELESDSPLVARYARDAAHRVEGLSENISGRNVGELLDSARGLARSQPALFFAGVVFAGFALSRFMKSSAPHDLAHRPDRPGSP